jgi:hypothetical protein
MLALGPVEALAGEPEASGTQRSKVDTERPEPLDACGRNLVALARNRRDEAAVNERRCYSNPEPPREVIIAPPCALKATCIGS